MNYRVEIFPDESPDVFNMQNADPIKEAIERKNMKQVGHHRFNEVPLWNLRIMQMDIEEHSTRDYYLQFNTESGQHRLIVVSSPHQTHAQSMMTMKINHSNAKNVTFNNRSDLYKLHAKIITETLKLISDDCFWTEINRLHGLIQNLSETIKYLTDGLDKKYARPLQF